MNSGVRNRIDKSLKDFRLTKLITSIERFTINRISLTGPGHNPTTTLSSQDGKWKDASAKIQIDSEKIQSLLDRISGNRIQEFLDDKKAPSIGTQKLEFSLGDDKNPSKRKWLVWRSGDKLYGKDLQSSRSEVVLIDQTVAELLPWDSKMILAKP
jgi:hypothetical protein